MWNGENAAKRLMELIGKLSGAHIGTCAEKWDEGVRQGNGRPAPCAPAQILSEYGGRKLADSGREM